MDVIDAPPTQPWRRRAPVGSLSLVVSAILVVAGIAVAYERIDWHEIGGILLRLDAGWLLAAFVAYWVVYPVNSLRFQYVTGWLREQAAAGLIPFMFILKLTCSTSFVQVAVPIGLVADVAKIGALRLFGRISLTEATRYTLFDRMVAMQWMSILGLMAIPAQITFGFSLDLIGSQLLLFGGALAAIAVVIGSSKWLGFIPFKIVQKVALLLAGYESLLAIRRLCVQLIFGLINLVLVFATLFFLLKAARLSADMWRIASLVPFLQFINSLPFLYMGWGGREIAVAMTLGSVAGLSLNEALAISAAWGIILIVSGLINGVFVLGDWRSYRRT